MRLRRMLRLAYNGSIQPYSSVNYTINNCLQLCLHLLYACEWVGYKNNECNIFSERPSVQIAFVPHTEIFEKSVDGCTGQYIPIFSMFTICSKFPNNFRHLNIVLAIEKNDRKMKLMFSDNFL